MKRHLSSVVLCLILASLAGSANARVFRKWGAALNSTQALKAIGGTVAYEAPITVNGASADLVLFSFTEPITTLFSKLQKSLNITQELFKNGSLGFATLHQNDRVIRFVVVSIDNDDHTLVFKVDQSEAEHAKSRQSPVDASIAGLPPYPSAQPIFSASDHAADMSIAISSTAANAASIYSFYDSSFKARQWVTALPQLEDTAPSGLVVYLKKNQVCCLHVADDPNSAVNRITILHKSLRSE